MTSLRSKRNQTTVKRSQINSRGGWAEWKPLGAEPASRTGEFSTLCCIHSSHCLAWAQNWTRRDKKQNQGLWAKGHKQGYDMAFVRRGADSTAGGHPGLPPLQPSTQTTMEPLAAKETQLESGQEDSKSSPLCSAWHYRYFPKCLVPGNRQGLGFRRNWNWFKPGSTCHQQSV